MSVPRNLLSDLPESSPGEVFDTLFENSSVRIERIVSHSGASPEGFWYDQEEDEWVLVLKGEATLRFHPDELVSLKPGDHLHIPRHRKHRVEWTSETTVWLAVHVA